MKTTARGYGRHHQLERQRWARIIARGGVRCARGVQCKHAVDGLGGVIDPGADWDLGHVDGDKSRYAGPEHAECNRAVKSHQPPRRRPRERHPGLID